MQKIGPPGIAEDGGIIKKEILQFSEISFKK